MMVLSTATLGFLLTLSCFGPSEALQKVGDLTTKEYEASGSVYIVDESTLRITNFGYNGKGPDAFVYVGTDAQPNGRGFKLEYPQGDPEAVLGAFTGTETIELKLPTNVKASQLKWLSIWCRQYSVNFGDVYFKASAATSTSRTDDKQAEGDKKKSDSAGHFSTGWPWLILTAVLISSLCL